MEQSAHKIISNFQTSLIDFEADIFETAFTIDLWLRLVTLLA